MECYRRDLQRDARCWICGQRIDYTARAGTPDSWEGDHYYPPELFPELANEPTNIRPSHSSCNRSRKRDLIPDRQIGNPSRDWGL